MSTNPQKVAATLPAKIQAWFNHINNNNNNKKNSTTNTLNLSNALDLTVSPASKGASFPYSILPPLRHLTYEELVNDFLKLPSIGLTALGSFVSGVLFALGAEWLKRKRATLPLRAIVGCVASVLILKWLSGRFPHRQRVSKPLNVSDSAKGPCMVTGPVVMLTNSHAGTHADTPQHFIHCHQHQQDQKKENSSNGENNNNNNNNNNNSCSQQHLAFHKASYTGDCIVLDISPSLHARNTREIDDAVLEDALLRYNSSSSQQDQSSSVEWHQIWRLILCTKRFDPDRDADVWKPDFPYFSVSGATFLATKCPRLLMIGTDSPSVDRSDASPLNENSHGVFWKHRIAIVENINCAPLYARLAGGVQEESNNNNNNNNVGTLVKGQVQCVFNDAQKFSDAEGCNVLFYPE